MIRGEQGVDTPQYVCKAFWLLHPWCQKHPILFSKWNQKIELNFLFTKRFVEWIELQTLPKVEEKIKHNNESYIRGK